MSTPTRRGALQFSVAALFAGATVPALAGATNPDAELLAAAAEFERSGERLKWINNRDCDLTEEEPVILKAWGEFDDYIDDMVAHRRRHLTEDLLSELIGIEDAGDRLDAGELRMLAFSILVAGTDTTRSQLAASMQVLCDHPDQLALLRDQPELAMRAVEETMRHSPSMCSFFTLSLLPVYCMIKWLLLFRPNVSPTA